MNLYRDCNWSMIVLLSAWYDSFSVSSSCWSWVSSRVFSDFLESCPSTYCFSLSTLAGAVALRAFALETFSLMEFCSEALMKSAENDSDFLMVLTGADTFLSLGLLCTFLESPGTTSTLSSSHSSSTSVRLEARNWCLLSALDDELRALWGRILGNLPWSLPSLISNDEECRRPVVGLAVSSSGSGSSLKELGGLATWLVDPE